LIDKGKFACRRGRDLNLSLLKPSSGFQQL
jgi:hypothetical protein